MPSLRVAHDCFARCFHPEISKKDLTTHRSVFLLGPLGFPLRNLTPLRCRWESAVIERRSGVVRKERSQERKERNHEQHDNHLGT